MRVIHLDRKGNIIPDLSAIKWSEEVSRTVWEAMNPGRKAKQKEGATSGKPQD